MHRRHLLAAVAALAGAAGCAGSSDEPPADGSVTPMPVPTDDTSTPARSVDGTTEIAAAVQPGVVVTGTDSIAVRDDAGQYLVLDVAGDAPARSAVEFRFAGASYAPEEQRSGLYRDGTGGVTYGRDGGPLVFALPATGDATDAELVWPGGRWAPPPAVVERLAAPLAPFSVSLDGPETATAGDDPELAVRVRNDGERDGRYVLALNRQGPRIAYTPVARLAGELAAGESETLTVDAVAPDGDRGSRYTLDVPGERDDIRHTISVPGTATPAER